MPSSILRMWNAFRSATQKIKPSPSKRSSPRVSFVEALEPRTMLTAVFKPIFGVETTSQDDDEHMSKPPIYIIFWGSYWNAHPADQGTLLFAAAGVITSPFTHIVDQYGADGSNMVIGNWTVDSSDPPAGNFDDGNIDDVINAQIDNHTFPGPDDGGPKPIYVVVTPPQVLSDNPKAAGFNIVKGIFTE